MACTISCLCSHIVLSQNVTFENNTLLIDLPENAYENEQRYCIVIAQPIPDTTTISADVAITIGGDTTTVYPLVNNNCANIQAYQVATRTKYPTQVATNIGEVVFKLIQNINCFKCGSNAAAALPIGGE